MHPTSTIVFVFKLMDRGLTSEEINQAMSAMIGKDWREVKVEAWAEKLKARGYLSEEAPGLTLDDMEALIIGAAKLRRTVRISPGP